MNGPANLHKKLDRIISAIGYLCERDTHGSVAHSSADVGFAGTSNLDAIVVDPPYFDSLFYSPLSNIFLDWKRPILNEIGVSANASEVESELSATRFMKNIEFNVVQNYIDRMTIFLVNSKEALNKNGTHCMIFGHKSVLAWAAICRAYVNSEMYISSCQPLCIERKDRPRSMTSMVSNTCICLVSKKEIPREARNLYKTIDVFKESKKRSRQLLGLRNDGWEDEDIAMASVAVGVALLALSERKETSFEDITSAVQKINEVVLSEVGLLPLTERGTL
jgi:putative DNA methylase